MAETALLNGSESAVEVLPSPAEALAGRDFCSIADFSTSEIAAVLERFLALYCSVNSFSRFIATTKGREGELRRWAPRLGFCPR